jgi:G3E family GTPase
MTDSGVCESYALDDVITTVDTVTGLSTIEKHPESVRQVAVADRIILTKTDLALAGTAAICKRISSINPSAPITIAINGVLDASTLFRSLGPRSVDILESVSRSMPPESAEWQILRTPTYRRDFHILHRARAAAARRNARASAVCAGGQLRRRLAARERHCRDHRRTRAPCGDSRGSSTCITRRYGSITGHRDDRRTRIVFIGRNIRQTWVLALIDLLDAEVSDQTMRLGATAGAI